MAEKTFNVELKNARVTLQVAAGQPIYKAALEAGVQLPIGCDYGGCITCAAKPAIQGWVYFVVCGSPNYRLRSGGGSGISWRVIRKPIH